MKIEIIKKETIKKQTNKKVDESVFSVENFHFYKWGLTKKGFEKTAKSYFPSYRYFNLGTLNNRWKIESLKLKEYFLWLYSPYKFDYNTDILNYWNSINNVNDLYVVGEIPALEDFFDILNRLPLWENEKELSFFDKKYINPFLNKFSFLTKDKTALTYLFNFYYLFEKNCFAYFKKKFDRREVWVEIIWTWDFDVNFWNKNFSFDKFLKFGNTLFNSNLNTPNKYSLAEDDDLAFVEEWEKDQTFEYIKEKIKRQEKTLNSFSQEDLIYIKEYFFLTNYLRTLVKNVSGIFLWDGLSPSDMTEQYISFCYHLYKDKYEKLLSQEGQKTFKNKIIWAYKDPNKKKNKKQNHENNYSLTKESLSKILEKISKLKRLDTLDMFKMLVFLISSLPQKSFLKGKVEYEVVQGLKKYFISDKKILSLTNELEEEFKGFNPAQLVVLLNQRQIELLNWDKSYFDEKYYKENKRNVESYSDILYHLIKDFSSDYTLFDLQKTKIAVETYLYNLYSDDPIHWLSHKEHAFFLLVALLKGHRELALFLTSKDNFQCSYISTVNNGLTDMEVSYNKNFLKETTKEQEEFINKWLNEENIIRSKVMDDLDFLLKGNNNKDNSLEVTLLYSLKDEYSTDLYIWESKEFWIFENLNSWINNITKKTFFSYLYSMYVGALRIKSRKLENYWKVDNDHPVFLVNPHVDFQINPLFLDIISLFFVWDVDYFNVWVNVDYYNLDDECLETVLYYEDIAGFDYQEISKKVLEKLNVKNEKDLWHFLTKKFWYKFPLMQIIKNFFMEWQNKTIEVIVKFYNFIKNNPDYLLNEIPYFKKVTFLWNYYFTGGHQSIKESIQKSKISLYKDIILKDWETAFIDCFSVRNMHLFTKEKWEEKISIEKIHKQIERELDLLKNKKDDELLFSNFIFEKNKWNQKVIDKLFEKYNKLKLKKDIKNILNLPMGKGSLFISCSNSSNTAADDYQDMYKLNANEYPLINCSKGEYLWEDFEKNKPNCHAFVSVDLAESHKVRELWDSWYFENVFIEFNSTNDFNNPDNYEYMNWYTKILFLMERLNEAFPWIREREIIIEQSSSNYDWKKTKALFSNETTPTKEMIDDYLNFQFEDSKDVLFWKDTEFKTISFELDKKSLDFFVSNYLYTVHEFINKTNNSSKTTLLSLILKDKQGEEYEETKLLLKHVFEELHSLPLTLKVATWTELFDDNKTLELAQNTLDLWEIGVDLIEDIYDKYEKEIKTILKLWENN